MKKLYKMISVLLCMALLCGLLTLFAAAQNDSFETAQPVVFNTTYEGTLDAQQKNAFYRIELPSSGRITVDLKAPSFYANRCYLKNSAASDLDSYLIMKQDGDRYRETRSYNLTAGVYYWAVSASTNSGSYEVTFSFVSANETIPESQNETFNNPDTAKTVSLDQTYIGQLAINDNIDYYRFELPSSGRITIDLKAPSFYANRCYLKNNSASDLDSYLIMKQDGDRYRETRSYNLTAGVYYWAVSASSNTGNYELCIYLSYLLGDVNNNGKITTEDARLALRRAIGLETYPENSPEYRACDADKNGVVNTADARTILRVAIGLEKLGKY